MAHSKNPENFRTRCVSVIIIVLIYVAIAMYVGS